MRDLAGYLFQHLSQTVFTVRVEPDGRLPFELWNPACERLLGIPASKVLGKTASEVFGAEIGARFEERYRACVVAREPIEYEEEVILGGELGVARTQLLPVLEGERVTRVLGISVDLGPERRSALALEASEVRYQRLLETLQEGIWALDAKGVTTFANRSMEKMLGYEPGEMTGKHLFEFMDEEGVAIAKENLRKREAGLSDTHEFALVTKGGRRVETLMATSPLTSPSGEYAGAIAGVLDITSRREAERARAQLERKLLETQRLESLGVLAGGIAHDFNNLLTAVLGHASLALAASTLEEAKSAIGGIEEGARRAAEMCRQLLAYSGKGKFQVAKVDLTSLVRDTAELLRVSIKKSARLEFDLAPRLAPIDADASQVRQVLMNLLINASEALDEGGGTITLRTGALTVDEATRPKGRSTRELSPGRYVFVEVVDDGCGLRDEVLDRIFDPFFTTKFTGRGLGLSAVLGIVHGHHGALYVASTPGRGSTFTVYFPRAAGTAARTPAAPKLGQWRGQGLVLVVDDEPLVRATTARLVRHLGFEVLTAEDGLEALETVRACGTELACVVLDLMMPRLGGEPAFHAMREIAPDLPIVLMSGYDEKEAAGRFAGHRLEGFLEKPFDLDQLRDRLRKATEKRAVKKAP